MKSKQDIKRVGEQVKELLGSEKSGHDYSHVERVYEMAMRFARQEKADLEVVALASLLHDADDYKLFGIESAKNLTNAKRIMKGVKISAEKQKRVLEIIDTMSYTKLLEGVRPKSLEGKVVSDADMLDAIGANGITRCFEYGFSEKGSGVLFDRNLWPDAELNADKYRGYKTNKTDNIINHFFEKMLKIKGFMMTDSGKKESTSRQKIMVDFLRQFFKENDLKEWNEYLGNYLAGKSLRSKGNFASSKKFCEKYFDILSDGEFPEFLRDYMKCPSLQRLKGIAVCCGANWTASFRSKFWYSNYEHSIGVALICWSFTKDRKCTIAGLLHDIATPAFKHCIDFMNKDHNTQESTEDKTEEIIRGDRKLMKLLKEDGIKVEEVMDYKIYPIADNDQPKLSADRLEYLFVWGCMREPVWDLDDVADFYNDLTIAENEDGVDEIVFEDKILAEEFAVGANRSSTKFLSPTNRISVEFIADIIRKAIELGGVRYNDLWKLSERQVVNKIKKNKVLADAWVKFENNGGSDLHSEKIENVYCKKVPHNKRHVNPLVMTEKGVKRISKVSKKANKSIQDLLSCNFDDWISLDISDDFLGLQKDLHRESANFYFSSAE